MLPLVKSGTAWTSMVGQRDHKISGGDIARPVPSDSSL
jgi:hypothetical protein